VKGEKEDSRGERIVAPCKMEKRKKKKKKKEKEKKRRDG
jgi:hypothetical protein